MVAEYLRILGDDKRGKITMLLSYCPLTGVELKELLDIQQTNLSKHLKVLEEADLISSFKIGRYKYYYLNETFITFYPFINVILDEYKKECMKENRHQDIEECISEQLVIERHELIRSKLAEEDQQKNDCVYIEKESK